MIRFIRMVVIRIVLGAMTGLLFGLTVPTFFGHHSLLVTSGSIESSIHTGDLVVMEIGPTHAAVGDVVTFATRTTTD